MYFDKCVVFSTVVNDQACQKITCLLKMWILLLSQRVHIYFWYCSGCIYCNNGLKLSLTGDYYLTKTYKLSSKYVVNIQFVTPNKVGLL